jgi:coenzyme PQQ biosynthesis protein PqqD
MIELASVVCLSPKARLRFDRHAQQHMLLYPERGLLLNPSAADIVLQCTNARPVVAIIEHLIAKYGEQNRASITQDVLSLLRGLSERGLLRELAS